MKCRFGIWRNFCKAVPGLLNNQLQKQKLDFSKLHHVSKLPKDPVKSKISLPKEVYIDAKFIQSLERLSLVNLDGEVAFRTLCASIQFADRIGNINTFNINPLYTVIDKQTLRLRTDEVSDGNCREYILQNSQLTDEDYFISPPGNIPLQQ